MIEKKTLDFEKTVLIGVISARQDEDQALEYLAELAFLAHTAGGEVIKQFTQKVTLPNPKTFIGSELALRRLIKLDISSILKYC